MNTKGLAGNNNGKNNDDFCDRFGKCLSMKNISAKKIHEDFALTWKVREDELLFEKWMTTQDWETKFYQLKVLEKDIDVGEKFCGKNVCNVKP